MSDNDDYLPSPDDPPFARVGGAEAVRALAEAFYDVMERDEPALAALHQRDAEGRIDRGIRERFGLFLVGWLGGPQDYMEKHGHPRLRMRHAPFPVDVEMRDAWVRSMTKAMDLRGIRGGVRRYLDARFADVASFLRNR